FMNLHGIAIVFGGIIVASLASFPHTILFNAFQSAFRSFSPNSFVRPELAEKIVAVGTAYQKNMAELEREAETIDNRFLSDSVNLILEGLNMQPVLEIIEKRIEEKRLQIQSHKNVMLTLSKYSPALGLAATVLGLVDLLGQLHD